MPSRRRRIIQTSALLVAASLFCSGCAAGAGITGVVDLGEAVASQTAQALEHDPRILAISAVSRLYAGLFLNGVVALTVNAQNDPAAGGPEPADWTGLDPGRYDVAALRIGVLDALGQSNVRLYLGRGSVGPGCSMAEFAGSGCTDY